MEQVSSDPKRLPFSGWVGQSSPAMLAIIRILVAGVLLASALWEHLPSTVLLPRSMLQPMGVMTILRGIPGFEAMLTSPIALAAWQWTTIALLACALVGFKSRVTLPLAAFGYLVLGGTIRQYAWFYHTGLLPCLLLFLLAFLPCARAFSIDAWLRHRRGLPVPDPFARSYGYGIARYLTWVLLAVPYTAAGLSKVRQSGLYWWEAENMKGIVLEDSLNPMEFDWGLSLALAEAPDVFFAFLGFCGVYGEVFFGLVLVSRWARFVFPLAMAGMHVGIWFLQNILFFDLIILQLIFFDVDAWLRRVIPPRPAPQPLEPPPGRRFYNAAAAGVCGIIILLATCWLYRIEQYPLTAMQMYSGKNETGVIQWLHVVGHDVEGNRERVELAEGIPAFADSRYRDICREALDPEMRWRFDEFIEVCLRELNRRRAPQDRLVAIEVQRWHWNFRDAPGDPEHGELVESYLYRVP